MEEFTEHCAPGIAEDIDDDDDDDGAVDCGAGIDSDGGQEKAKREFNILASS